MPTEDNEKSQEQIEVAELEENIVSLGSEVSAFIRQINACAKSLPLVMFTLTGARRLAAKKHLEFLQENGELEKEEDGRKIFKVDTTIGWKLIPLKQDHEDSIAAYRLIPKSFIVSLVSQFDFFVGRLIRCIYLKKPKLLHSSDKQLTLEQLISFGSIDSAKEYLLEKEIEGILRKSHTEQFDWMENKFGLPLRKGLSIWPQFIELTERRNLFVHTGGVISSQYLQVCKKQGVVFDIERKVGEELGVGGEYFKASYDCIYEMGSKLSQVLWRKLFPKEIKDAGLTLINSTYDLILAESYSLAESLLDFAVANLTKHGSEESRKIYVINLAQIYKWQGHEDKYLDLIKGEDWSACSDKFRLGVAVLKDKFDEASEIMQRIGDNNNEIDKGAYLQWPLFKEFRKSDQFIYAFKKVFGHPPETYDEAPTEGENDYASA